MWALYCVENTVNGKLYIGKTNNTKRRFHKHKISSENIPLNRAIKKYGAPNFTFEIIRYFDSEDETYEMEKYWIDYLRSSGMTLYNIAEGGKGIFSGPNHYLYGKHHTDKSKNKMSISHIGKIQSNETKMKISDSLKGHIISDESKKKNSKSHIGKKHSEETKIIIGTTSKGRKHSEKTIDILSICNKGENNPSSKVTDNEVKQILTLWFSIDKNIRETYGYKAKFYKEHIENIFNIKPITLYEYLKGKKRKDIFLLFI